MQQQRDRERVDCGECTRGLEGSRRDPAALSPPQQHDVSDPPSRLPTAGARVRVGLPLYRACLRGSRNPLDGAPPPTRHTDSNSLLPTVVAAPGAAAGVRRTTGHRLRRPPQPEKGVADVLTLAQRFPEVPVTIIGSGELDAHVAEHASRLDNLACHRAFWGPSGCELMSERVHRHPFPLAGARSAIPLEAMGAVHPSSPSRTEASPSTSQTPAPEVVPGDAESLVAACAELYAMATRGRSCRGRRSRRLMSVIRDPATERRSSRFTARSSVTLPVGAGARGRHEASSGRTFFNCAGDTSTGCSRETSSAPSSGAFAA